MKGIVKVEIEIPVEYDELSKERLLEELSEHYNGKYNKSGCISSSTGRGCYSWKLPKKNAKVKLTNKN